MPRIVAKAKSKKAALLNPRAPESYRNTVFVLLSIYQKSNAVSIVVCLTGSRSAPGIPLSL